MEDNKQFYDTKSLEMSDRNRSRTMTIFMAALVVILCAVVAFMAMGAWYVRDIANSSNDCDQDDSREPSTYKYSAETFYLEVPRTELKNFSIVHETIVVNDYIGFEYMIQKDPIQTHTMFIIAMDRLKGITYLYGSELGQCLLFPDTARTIGESLIFLRQFDGTTLPNVTEKYDYRVDYPLADFADIPQQMAAFCTESNTYMMRPASKDEWRTDAQLFHVCVCYYYCWCTYCIESSCWGECCDSREA